MVGFEQPKVVHDAGFEHSVLLQAFRTKKKPQTSQPSTDNNLESCPRVTVLTLTSTSDLPNGTANLLDLGPQFVHSIKTIKKRTEFDVNVQLVKLAYRLRWKEIHLEQSTAENEQPTAAQNSSSHTIEQTIEHCPFDKYCKAPDIKFQHLESSLQHLSIGRLKTTHSVCPVIYLLTKTHKFQNIIPSSNLKVRPIISGCGSSR
jgi:hypothetical protein